MPINTHSAVLFAALAAAPVVGQDLTLPPETARIVIIVEGRGTQNYTCTAQPAGYNWIFTAPQAQLFNLATGKVVGHHDAGPTWTLEDGSTVKGTLLVKKPADAAVDIPWLLLKAQPTGTTAGTLSPVTLVRRYNTRGGSPPPAGCDAQHVSNTIQVPYSATYAFYTEGPSLTRP